MDLIAKEARHESGLVVRFRHDAQGYLGYVVAGADKVHPMDAARRMREAGEMYDKAIKKANS